MKPKPKIDPKETPPRRMFEASTEEFAAITALVTKALAAKMYPDRPDAYVRCDAVYADRVVVCMDGRLWSYRYTIDEQNQVQLGDAQEVILDYSPVGAMREAQGIFLEAQDDKGLKWLIRVIRAGKSGNNNYYPDSVLREAVALFNGVRVFVKSDDEHIEGKGKSFKNLIGRIVEPVFIEGKKKDAGEIRGVLELLEAATDVTAKLREAWERGMSKDLFGFSIDAFGKAKFAEGVSRAERIAKVNSVDLIIEPGAGGELINLIEAQVPQEGEMKLLQRMIEAIKKANQGKLPEGLNEDDDAAVELAFREAIATQAQIDATAKAATDALAKAAATTVTREDLRMIEARAHARSAIATSGLAEIAMSRVRKHFVDLNTFTEADVDSAIKAERDYVASFTESGKVRDLGDGASFHAGESQAEKTAIMLDAFFDENHKEHRQVRSFKECYIQITGDRLVTGRMENCDRSRLRESLGADFRESIDSAAVANVLGAALRRAMIREYGVQGNYDIWRTISDIVPVMDFRTNERTRFGGYGDLPIVNEGQPYGSLATPTDEKATYAVAKRGGTEDMTLEQIKNDDVGLIRRIPIKLGRSAKRTLSKFVMDFIRSNPTIYDGLTLYHATHANLFTVALSLAEYGVHRVSMLKQTELSSADRIGIAPAYLFVPFDLEETATNLFTQGTENETKFLSRIRPTVVGVWYWTDVTDWATAADKNDVPFVEIGFLDGQEEPDLFVQDNPTVGSMFTNDKLTWKVRHIYGGNVLDFRGTTKAVVAG